MTSRNMVLKSIIINSDVRKALRDKARKGCKNLPNGTYFFEMRNPAHINYDLIVLIKTCVKKYPLDSVSITCKFGSAHALTDVTSYDSLLLKYGNVPLTCDNENTTFSNVVKKKMYTSRLINILIESQLSFHHASNNMLTVM